MHVKAVLITIIFCLGLISSLSTTAIATTYDNFDGSDFLDAARWTTGERTDLVVDGKLLSGFRKLGGAGSSNSQFSDRASVNAIQAVVNVNSIETTGNPEIRARLAGFFCDSNNAAALALTKNATTSAAAPLDPTTLISITPLIFSLSRSMPPGSRAKPIG